MLSKLIAILLLFSFPGSVMAQTKCACVAPSGGFAPTFFGIDWNSQASSNVPTFSFGSWRTWDHGLTWKDIETSSGTYTFTTFDASMALLPANVTDVLYTFGKVPTWAGGGASFNNPPSDIGSGDAQWKGFVTNLTAHMVANYPTIHWFFELWNEFDLSGTWTGTAAQIETMAADASPIIRAALPTATITSPSISTSGTAGRTAMQGYITAGGASVIDVWAYHEYVGGTGTVDVITAYNNFNLITGLGSLPIWVTEGGSQGTVWPTLTSDQRVATVAQEYLLYRNLGVGRFYWYASDNTQNIGYLCVLTGTVCGNLLPAGQAYNVLYIWMVASTAYSCSGGWQ